MVFSTSRRSFGGCSLTMPPPLPPPPPTLQAMDTCIVTPFKCTPEYNTNRSSADSSQYQPPRLLVSMVTTEREVMSGTPTSGPHIHSRCLYWSLSFHLQEMMTMMMMKIEVKKKKKKNVRLSPGGKKKKKKEQAERACKHRVRK